VNSDVEDRTPEISGPPPSPPTRPRTAEEWQALYEKEVKKNSALEGEKKEMKGMIKKVVRIRNQGGRKSPNPDGSTGSNKSQSSEAMDELEHDMELSTINFSDLTTEEMDDVPQDSSFVMVSNPEDDPSLSSLIYYPSPESPRYSDEDGVQLKEVSRNDVKRINPHSQSSRNAFNAFDEEDVKISSPKVPSSVGDKSPEKANYKPSSSNKTKNQPSSGNQLKNGSRRMFNHDKLEDVDLGEDNPKSNQTADIENQIITPRSLPGGDEEDELKKNKAKKSYPKKTNSEKSKPQKNNANRSNPKKDGPPPPPTSTPSGGTAFREPKKEGTNW